MELRSPGRFDYSPITGRPDFSWPNGRRLAVYLSLNIEHFSYNEGLGISYSGGIPHPNTYNWGWREYGNRVGFWRILELCEELNIPLSALVNSEIYAHAPAIIDALLARDDEIIAHGRTNSEHQNGLSEQDERTLIDEVTTRIQEYSGIAPAGWLSPGVNPSVQTTDLLEEAGYKYILDWPIDDQPVWLSTRSGGQILSIPYPHEVNDIPLIALHHGSAKVFADAVIDAFDEMFRQSHNQSLVYGISIHTFLIGQPLRLPEFRRAMQHIMDRSDEIWFTTPKAIGEYVTTLPAH